MKTQRFSVARLMGLVALVAVNVAVLRLLYSSRHVELLVGGSFLWLLLQWNLLRIVRSRGAARRSWIGFLAGMGVAASSQLLAQRFPASPVGTLWLGYFQAAEPLALRAYPVAARLCGPVVAELALLGLVILLGLLPIICAALIARLAVRAVDERLGRHGSESRTSAASEPA